jgi:hypothetical protein
MLDINNLNSPLDLYKVADLALFCKLITLQMPADDERRKKLETDLETLETELSEQITSVSSVEKCLRNLVEILILHESISNTIH